MNIGYLRADVKDKTILNINSLCITLETLVDDYRKAIVWLSYGNHKVTPSPSLEETQQILKGLQDEIIATISKIDAKTTYITS